MLWQILEKSHMLKTLLIFNTFFICTTEFVLLKASLKYPYDYLLSEDLLIRKEINWSKLKNFVNIVLITHLFSRFHILIFGSMNIARFVFFGLNLRLFNRRFKGVVLKFYCYQYILLKRPCASHFLVNCNLPCFKNGV